MIYKNSDISSLQTVASHFHHNQIPTFVRNSIPLNGWHGGSDLYYIFIIYIKKNNYIKLLPNYLVLAEKVQNISYIKSLLFLLRLLPHSS